MFNTYEMCYTTYNILCLAITTRLQHDFVATPSAYSVMSKVFLKLLNAYIRIPYFLRNKSWLKLFLKVKYLVLLLTLLMFEVFAVQMQKIR